METQLQTQTQTQTQGKVAFDWLTDHSRAFLEAGYLTPGDTPETVGP